MCDIELDGEKPECFSGQDVVARKVRVCCECNNEISVGEKYRNESGKWNGEFETYKTCLDCLSLRETFFCSYEYGRMYEALDEYLMDNGGEVFTDDLSTLTDTARQILFGMIEYRWNEWYEENPVYPAMRMETRTRDKWYNQYAWQYWRNRDVCNMCKEYGV